jgi:hypothetical protein
MRPDAIDVTSVRLPGTILPVAVSTGEPSLPFRGTATFAVGARSVRGAAQPVKTAAIAVITPIFQGLCILMDQPPTASHPSRVSSVSRLNRLVVHLAHPATCHRPALVGRFAV